MVCACVCTGWHSAHCSRVIITFFMSSFYFKSSSIQQTVCITFQYERSISSSIQMQPINTMKNGLSLNTQSSRAWTHEHLRGTHRERSKAWSPLPQPAECTLHTSTMYCGGCDVAVDPGHTSATMVYETHYSCVSTTVLCNQDTSPNLVAFMAAHWEIMAYREPVWCVAC